MTKQQIIATLIVSLVATGLIELLKPAIRAGWARVNRPSPLSLQGKVQLAGQVAMQEKTLERLNHLSAYSKDIYLYLFQLGLAIFISVGTALFVFVYYPHFSVPLVFLLVVAAVLVLGAFAEAVRLSAKNIEATKGKVQKFINEGRAKLDQ